MLRPCLPLLTSSIRNELNEEFKLLLTILEDPKVRDAFHHPNTSRERRAS